MANTAEIFCCIFSVFEENGRPLFDHLCLLFEHHTGVSGVIVGEVIWERALSEVDSSPLAAPLPDFCT
jgi:hypothetical protein